ncbi:PREDICTED: deoxyadenosine kinase-like [Amphimedon queenslandica]|uniref:Deoxynucleoside kinase domain-containing protein n=2 Tax=Amphimedon queenslandica TaxID=400682 RepID=A0A1X7UAT4_AMPQE|nr:PREDICTED: deoxyadenosine kinase-like [Amphimedon queenslandica]|eukprot:XP_003388493.1 PREDICTED: deoxyadenosine kinase-like [Amphimedon queenslandica]
MIGEEESLKASKSCSTGQSSSRSGLLTMDQKHSSSDIFISISGLIGAGKSTLATKLAEKMGLPCFYEPVMDNEYLADFYKDPARYSFPLQIYLLNRRFQQHQSIIWQGQGGVQDRTIYEDSVFARVLMESNLMEEREYRTYLSLFSNMSNFMKKPNLIVHLDVSPEESLRRIKNRSRDCESSITLEYLQNLHKAYEVFIADIARIIPVIRVNYERFRTTEEMADMIVREYSKMCSIRYVDFKDKTPDPEKRVLKDAKPLRNVSNDIENTPVN